MPRARTPVHQPNPYLVRDEVREKVSEQSEKSQPGNSISRKNPGAAAFTAPHSRGSRSKRLLGSRRDIRGPIFHTRKTSERKDRGASTFCVTPPGLRGQARLLRSSLLRFGEAKNEKCARDRGSMPKILRLPVRRDGHRILTLLNPPWAINPAGLNIAVCVVSF